MWPKPNCWPSSPSSPMTKQLKCLQVEISWMGFGGLGIRWKRILGLGMFDQRFVNIGKIVGSLGFVDGFGWMSVKDLASWWICLGKQEISNKSQRTEQNKNLPWIHPKWLHTRSFHRRNLRSIYCFHWLGLRRQRLNDIYKKTNNHRSNQPLKAIYG